VQVYLGDIFLLDPIHGLFRLDVLGNCEVTVTGRYIKEGFTRFGVYIDDLEDKLLVALANAHAVYEVDWSDIREQVLINKYSLMEFSHVRQLLINELFVIVQSAANASNETNPNFEIDYTWVFVRGARSYFIVSNIINHGSRRVYLEFNQANNRLLLGDDDGFALYQLDLPILTLSFNDSSKQGSSELLELTAESKDPSSPR
jgi:hypothetical protein